MRYFLLHSILLFTFSTNAQVRKLQAEPNHTTFGFRISISGFTEATGKLGEYKINMDWNDEDMTASNILAEIQATSINTGVPDRDEHLRTADFF